MSFELRLRPGIEELIQHGVDEALHEAGDYLLEKANEIAPLDTGELIDSSTVTVQGDEIAISYDTPYAARLHEHPEYNFQNGREGKWLEKTFDTEHEAALEIIAKHLKETFK